MAAVVLFLFINLNHYVEYRLPLAFLRFANELMIVNSMTRSISFTRTRCVCVGVHGIFRVFICLYLLCTKDPVGESKSKDKRTIYLIPTGENARTHPNKK